MDVDKIAVVSCVLGGFDGLVDPPTQDIAVTFQRWTDGDFPPIAQWDPRLQYRIPKTHAWEMLPNYDYYIWLDGKVTFAGPHCATAYLQTLDDGDIALFPHPSRQTLRQEVEHIDQRLNRTAGSRGGQDYLLRRYKNGLHWQQLMLCEDDAPLYDSTSFIYRNSAKVRAALKDWWYYGSRYYTCDQVNLSYVLKKHKLELRTFDKPIAKTNLLKEASQHA